VTYGVSGIRVLTRPDWFVSIGGNDTRAGVSE
jgi:hypothetical protein